jgi:hypothetical protein
MPETGIDGLGIDMIDAATRKHSSKRSMTGCAATARSFGARFEPYGGSGAIDLRISSR